MNTDLNIELKTDSHSPLRSRTTTSQISLFVASVVIMGTLIGCLGGWGRSSSLTSGTPLELKKISSKNLENLFQISPSIYSGSEPKTDTAFEELNRLGIRTVVSVDGIRPNLKEAHKQNLRYVHIPIGYDGIEEHAQLSLIQLIQSAEGPYYIHCHHGRHRGPAAAAIAAIAKKELTNEEGWQVLEQARTGQEYTGLWQAVESFDLPKNQITEWPKLLAFSKVDSFSASMAMMDRAISHLEELRDNDWKTIKEHPDLTPDLAALHLREGFVEAQRTMSSSVPQDFKQSLEEGIKNSKALESALKKELKADIETHFIKIKRSCRTCHKEHRN